MRNEGRKVAPVCIEIGTVTVTAKEAVNVGRMKEVELTPFERVFGELARPTGGRRAGRMRMATACFNGGGAKGKS